MFFRYAEVRRIGFKVYDEQFINKQAPLKKKWLMFWNDMGLELARKKTQRVNMEGMIKKSWSYDGGRKKACVELVQGICTQYHLKHNPFKVYCESADKKEKEIKRIKDERRQVEDNLIARVHANTISSDDKISKRNQLKKLDFELEKVNNDYSKILTNWTNYMNRIQKKGFEKQKRGPKPKELKFRTAKELKSMVSKSTEDDLMECVDSADDRSENTENADTLGNRTTETQRNPESHKNKSKNGKDTVSTQGENQTTSQRTNSSNDIPEHDTHLGVKIIFPEVCQNTVGNSEKGTNACSGISIQLAEYFRTNKLQINRESVMEVFPKVIREMVSKFDWENLELMDVNTALKRLNFDNISVQSEVFWHELLHTSIRDPVEICAEEYKKSVNSTAK
jgi:hypothetical protein